ncbi:MAG: hypothetical protein K0U54_02695 [Bacteroidetes bacterium]|nr:hypothetical protein [Bacteroidota bacterium]
MTFEEALKIYDEIIATIPEIDRLGKSMPYTGTNTYMYSLVNKSGEVGVRLSKEDQASFTQRFPDHGVYKSHGAVMKDYVHLPEKLLSQHEEIADYLRKGLAHANSLPPQKRKKK